MENIQQPTAIIQVRDDGWAMVKEVQGIQCGQMMDTFDVRADRIC